MLLQYIFFQIHFFTFAITFATVCMFMLKVTRQPEWRGALTDREQVCESGIFRGSANTDFHLLEYDAM
jgi:hypothetical protein